MRIGRDIKKTLGKIGNIGNMGHLPLPEKKNPVDAIRNTSSRLGWQKLLRHSPIRSAIPFEDSNNAPFENQLGLRVFGFECY